MKDYKIVGYSFEGAIHCESCAHERFPGGEGTDREGNEIHPYFAGEASQNNQSISCDTCGDEVWESYDTIESCANCGKDSLCQDLNSHGQCYQCEMAEDSREGSARHSHDVVVASVDAFAKLVKAITPPEELERLRQGEPIEDVIEDAILLTDEALQSVLGRPLWFPSDVSVGNCTEAEMRRDHDLIDSVWEICADLKFFMK